MRKFCNMTRHGQTVEPYSILSDLGIMSIKITFSMKILHCYISSRTREFRGFFYLGLYN